MGVDGSDVDVGNDDDSDGGGVEHNCTITNGGGNTAFMIHGNVSRENNMLLKCYTNSFV